MTYIPKKKKFVKISMGRAAGKVMYPFELTVVLLDEIGADCNGGKSEHLLQEH